MFGVIGTDQLDRRLLQLLVRIGQFHAVDLAGIYQPLEMLFQPENRRTVLGLITTHAFKQARRITQHM